MKGRIELKDVPHTSGVYCIKNKNNQVVYVGSSGNLYKRMLCHNHCLKVGEDNGCKKDFYTFLKTEQFDIIFIKVENYIIIEQILIDVCNPIYNRQKAYTGLGTYVGRESEYHHLYNKIYYQKNKELYQEYKASGGTLVWNDFLKEKNSNKITN